MAYLTTDQANRKTDRQSDGHKEVRKALQGIEASGAQRAGEDAVRKLV